MIVVTGAAGFIGSNLAGELNSHEISDIIAVDRFDRKEKNQNLADKKLAAKVDRDDLFNWLDSNHEKVRFIFHLGARTDTTETDEKLLRTLNTDYSKKVWQKCSSYQIPLIYASSAATYGGGCFGFSDDESLISKLKPLNAYGWSKHLFDLWVLEQTEKPPFWAGLKFFNVYGPNETHKRRMASVVCQAFRQIQETGKMKLFKSHRPDFRDGEQKRDFIFVGDVVKVMTRMMDHPGQNGIFNLGTGHARTFIDLTSAVFRALNLPNNIEYIDMPEDIRENYQYFTEAEMGKLKISYLHPNPFISIESGIKQS